MLADLATRSDTAGSSTAVNKQALFKNSVVRILEVTVHNIIAIEKTFRLTQCAVL